MGCAVIEEHQVGTACRPFNPPASDRVVEKPRGRRDRGAGERHGERPRHLSLRNLCALRAHALRVAETHSLSQIAAHTADLTAHG